ncbi:MAG: MFS transporter [Cyanobacteria bacterium SIG31]|nr:MFS transporter [Cyanobacteria bacterium SIG31]
MKSFVCNNKSAILWLSAAHLVCDTYGGFLNPIMPFIAAKLGFSMAIATVLVAITQICSNMLQPIFGFFADNILKRFFVFWGLILASIFIPLASSAPNILILTLFMILGCLGGSFFHPQSMGFVNLFSGKDCSNNMGFFVSMGSLGFAFGPLLAAFITQMIGLDKIFYSSFLGVILASLMFLFVPKLSSTEKKSEHKDFIKSFKIILADKQMNLLMLIAMMKSLVTNSSCVLLPFLWKSMGYSPFYIGLALFLFVFAGSIGSFVSPKLEKLVGSKAVIYFSMWGTFPMMLAFAFTYKTMPFVSMCIFALVGFTTMLAQPVTLVWAQKIMPEYKSIVSGFVNGFCWGTVALILTGLGAIAEQFGIINVLVVLSLIPMFTAFSVKFLKEV